MEELAEGHLLAGRYRLGPAVGHGAMGEVHLAEDIRLARPVAVKSLRPELARYPDVRQRFGQEARSAARISHPNVVRVYDSGEEGRLPYLVMECLPGSTLVDELAWGPLELRRARRVGLDVLGALDAAHRLGIVHRDVKPGNILLSADLDGPVKVSDFGIAKSADDHSLTDSGGLVGTAAYLAPERVAGEPAAPASDLYSLGVVLYEAVAGRRPYEADTSLAVALAIHMGGAPSLLELRPDLDPALADVVERALARDPSERWGSAAEMADALRAWRPGASGRDPATGATRIAAGAPVGAATVALPVAMAAAGEDDTLVDPGNLPAAADDSHGRRGPLTEVSASVPAAAVASTSAAPFDGRAPSRPSPPDQRRRRTIALAAAAAGLLLLVLIAGVATHRSGGTTTSGSPPSTAAPVAAPAAGAPTSTPGEATVAPARPSVAPAPGATRRTTTTPPTRPPTTSPTTVRVTTTPAPTTTSPPTTAPPPLPTTPTTIAAATSPRTPATG